MKTYTIDVYAYPKTYEIEATSEAEAVELAKAKFYEETGQSIYQTESV